MRYSLRDLLRRWKVRTSYLLATDEAGRAKEEAFRPRLTLLEDKSMPSGSPTGLVFQDLNAAGKSYPVFVNTQAPKSEAFTLSAGITNPVEFTDGALSTLAARLFQDTNGNGQQDVGELPVSSAYVQLVDSANNVLGIVTTDADGNFSFSSTAGRNSRSSVYSLPLSANTTYQLRTAFDRSLTETIQSGGDIGTFGVIEGGPIANVSGRVWTDTNGNGRFDLGEPAVANVTVFLLDGSNNVLDARVTAADGSYAFLNIPPATYSIRFDSLSLPNGELFTTENAPGSTAADNSDANTTTGQTAQFTLANGDDLQNIDAGVYVPVIIGDFAWEDLNANGIQDNGEGGEAGVVVNLRDLGGNIVATQTTDSTGLYLFSVIPGQYQIEFIAPPGRNFSPQNVMGGTPGTDSDANPATGRTAFVTFSSGDINTDLDAGFSAAATGTGVIGDFVFFDENDNGIQDPGEIGLPNAIINLRDGAGNIIASTSPDGFGFYQFTGLAAGQYQVEFISTAAFFSLGKQNQGADDRLDSDPNPMTGLTAVFTLGDGENNSSIDAAFIKPASALIGNFVWNDLDCDGIQDANEPGVGNVTVNLLDSAGMIFATTTTDANGLYSFQNLPAGSYSVEVILPTGFTFSPQNQGADNTLDSDVDPLTGRTVQFSVTTGGDTSRDAGLCVIPASLGDFVWEDLDGNGLQDVGEPGIANVTVNLLDAGGNVVATTTTNGTGIYSFTMLAPGTYSVQFVAPGGYVFTAANQGANDAIDSDANPANGTTGTVTLASGDNNTSLDAGLYRPAALGDRVFDDANNNGIQDPGEVGVPNVSVDLLDSGGNVITSTTTNASGNYLFSNLTPGTYAVRFIAPQGVSFSPANQGGDDALDSDANPLTGITGPYVLVSNQTNLTADAGLFSSAPVIGSIGDLVFFDANNNGIQDPQDFGLPNVVVNLLDGLGNFLATTTTNAAGNYLFANLQAGNYIIEVIVPADFGVSPQNQGGDDRVDSDIDPTTGRTSVITLAAGENNLDVDAGLTKVLTVVLGDFVWDDLDCDGIQDPGEPGVANVTVNLLDGLGNFVATTTTDGTGAYQFVGLAPGSYQIEFVLPTGFVFTPANQGGDDTLDSDANPATGRTQVVTLAAGQSDLTLDAGLCAVAALGDRVWLDANQNGIQDPGEVGVANVTVMLLDVGGNTLATQQTNASGNYLFTNLAPGTYSVMFTLPPAFVFTIQNAGGDDGLDSDADPLTGKTGNYTLMPNETNLTVDAGIFPDNSTQAFKIGDRVFLDTNCNGIQDAGEPGVQGITVELLNSLGNVIATTTTDATGMYMFLVGPGTFEVRFVALPGYAFTRQNAGGDDTVDSDADVTTGQTGTFTVNADDLTRDAGLVTLSSVSGFVYVDANDNGVFDLGEQPIANSTITLSGTDDLGNPVTRTGTTDATGQYVFTGIRPGTYTLTETQPKGFLDGKDSLGTPFPGTVNNDNITTITIDCSDTIRNGENYNFGELLPASLQGKVYFDINNNGIPDPGEPGIAAASLTLMGTDDRGNSIMRTLFSGPDGTYIFTGLRPGLYKVTQGQPPNWIDGKDRVGSAGGTLSNDMVSDITIPMGFVAINYDFGERIGGISNEPSKRDFLASTPPLNTPTLNGQASAMPASPTFGNAVASSQLSDPNAPRFLVTSGDAGSAPTVRVFDFGTGVELYTISAYSASFTGGVRTAVGDVTGDGIPDIITAPGFGGGPHIRVFDGSTGALVAEFFAYAASFTGGVFVAVGDVNGDGVGEIITGAGETGGPHVRVFTAGGALVTEFFAYDASFSGGVRVASGDVDGDGFFDIITGAGPGGGPHVRVFGGQAGQGILTEFFAYDASFRAGVYVAAGDVDGDMRADIITGGGAGAPSQVKAFKGTDLTLLYSAFAFGSSFTGGTRVGALDINGDCRDEILMAPGAGLAAFTRAFDVTAGADVEDFVSLNPANLGGAFVSGGIG